MGKIYYEDPETKTLSLRIESKEIPSLDSPDVELGRTKTHVTEDLKRWPAEPQPITHKRGMTIALTLYDIVLCLVPISLIVKAGLCIYAHHIDQDWTGPYIDSASNLSRTLIQFDEQLTTIFTLCFILIISTAVRRYALWKAERGATVAELEQYQASITPTSTLRAIWSLRAFNVSSFGLIVVWSWYYIGSQAAQREYSLKDSAPLQKIGIALESSASPSPFEDGTYGNITTVQKTDMTAQYHIYSKKEETNQGAIGSDVAGNALVPIYQDNPLFYPDPNTPKFVPCSHGWVDIQFINAYYSSSIGDVLYSRTTEDGILTTNASVNTFASQALIGTFSYETSYMYTNCSNFTLSADNTRPAGLLPEMSISLNMSAKSQATTGRVIDFYSDYNGTHAIHASCGVSRANVEVQVSCLASGCKVTKMRHSTKKPASVFNTPFDDNAFATSFLDALLLACGKPNGIDDATSFEQDIGYRGYDWYDTGDEPFNFTVRVAESEFYISNSLSRHINTFYTASKIAKRASLFDQELVRDNNLIQLNNTDPDFQFMIIKGAAYNVQYSLCIPWLIVDIVSCMVLFAAAVSAWWLRQHTLIPDIFGYVSSLTRENPHLDVPGGSTLSGLDRARRMKHVKVQIGDVASHRDAGRVGLTYIGDGESRAAGLAKHKRYV